MKTKIIKNYCYMGLGFPIELAQVEMVLVGNSWFPKIDVKKIARIVIEQLATKKNPLTGDEIKFIRVHFGMSLRTFANTVVHESHTAVKKWEDEKNKPTKMNPNTEFVIRNYIIEQTSSKSQKKGIFYTRISESKKFYNRKNKHSPIMHINKCA